MPENVFRVKIQQLFDWLDEGHISVDEFYFYLNELMKSGSHGKAYTV